MKEKFGLYLWRIVLVLFIVFFILYFWPGLYIYHLESGRGSFRINRITGTKQSF
jgi:hypothetical protein